MFVYKKRVFRKNGCYFRSITAAVRCFVPARRDFGWDGGVASRTGRSGSAIYEDIKKGLFPNSIPIGPRAVAWDSESIDQWIQQKIDQANERLTLTLDQPTDPIAPNSDCKLFPAKDSNSKRGKKTPTNRKPKAHEVIPK